MIVLVYSDGTRVESGVCHLTRRRASRRASAVLGRTWPLRGYRLADDADARQVRRWRWEMAEEDEPKPWTLTASQYQARRGVKAPWIAEISPFQYAAMSKRAKAEYDRRRAAEWEASASCKREWAALVIAAADRGEVTTETPGMSEEARGVLIHAEIDREKAAREAARRRAHEDNELRRMDQLRPGMRVWSVCFREYGIVGTMFKRRARVRFASREATLSPRELQRMSHDDVERSLRRVGPGGPVAGP